MAVSKEIKEFICGWMKDEYQRAIANGLKGTELSLKVKQLTLGLVQHILDQPGTPQKKTEEIQLAVEFERTIAGWITKEIAAQAPFVVTKEVRYDHMLLVPGERVIQLEDWRQAPEGHFMSVFKTVSGEDICLLDDEVKMLV